MHRDESIVLRVMRAEHSVESTASADVRGSACHKQRCHLIGILHLRKETR